MRPHRNPDIEAEVRYLSANEGGRSVPAYSGYRPNHLVAPDYLTSGHHEYKGKDMVYPGESAIAEIWFLSPEHYPKSMHIGKRIRIQEGSRLVGHAVVTQIFNPDLKQ